MKRILLPCLLAFTFAVSAQTPRTWRGVNGDWFNQANWTPAGVPGPGESILVTAGTISASQPIVLDGAMTWTGGDLGPSVVLQVAETGVLSVNGPGTATLLGVITNAGTIRLGNAAVLRLWQSSARVVNLPNAVIDSTSDDTITHYYSGAVLENRGLFRKSGGAGATTFTSGVVLHHYGTMDVVTGTVAMTGGSGAANAHAGARFLGAGTALLNGGSLTMDGPLMSTSLKVTGGALAGLGEISGVMKWTGGDIAGGAALNIATDGVLEISGAGIKNIVGALTNAGTIKVIDSGEVRLFQTASRLINLQGAVIDSQSDNGISHYYSGCVFRNLGVFRKSGGAGNTWIGTGVILENYGTIEALGGGILLAAGGAGNCHAYEGSRFLGAGTNLIAGGTFTLHGLFQSENILMTSGVFAGDGTLSGFARWTGGSIAGDAVTRVASDGVLEISGSLLKDIYGRLVNAGVVRMSGDAQTRLYSSASRVENLAGALFDSQSDDSVAQLYTGGTFVNSGTFRKSGGAGSTTFAGGTLFNNLGLVQVRSGTLTLGGGTSTGQFEVSEGCTLALPAGHAIGGGAAITGLGTTRLTGGTFTLDGDLTTANISLQGGTMVGTNGVIHGTLQWTGGAIGEGATLTVAEDGRLRVVGPGLVDLAGVVTNRGVVTLENAALLRLYSNRSLLLNERVGVVDSMSNDTLAIFYSGGVFRNQGLFRKSGGANTTINPGVVFENYGTVDVQVNAISLTGGGGGCHVFEGSRMLGAGTNLVNGGSITFHGGILTSNLQVTAGTIAGEGSVAGLARWTAGTLDGAASITVAPGATFEIATAATKDISGTLINEGTIVLKETAMLRFLAAAGRLFNRAGGLIDSQSDDVCTHFYTGGVLENQGTFRKSGGTGATTISPGVTFRNLGTVEVLSGRLSIGLGEGAGSFQTAADTTLDIDGNYHADAGSVIGGAGLLRFRSGSVTVDGEITCRNAVLAGASVSGTNGVLRGVLDWTSGSIGNLRIATNGVVNVIGAVAKDLGGTLVNEGLITLTNNATLRFFAGTSRLVIQPGGVMDSQSEDSFSVFYSGGTIENRGLLRKSGGSGTTRLATGGLTLHHYGRADSQVGVLQLNFGGSAVFHDGCSFTGAGTNQVNTETALEGVMVSSNLCLLGNVTGSGTLAGSAKWIAGTIAGTLTVGPDAALLLDGTASRDVTGTIVNQGTLTLNPDASIRIFASAGRIKNELGALMELRGAGSFTHFYSGGVMENRGIVRKTGAGTTFSVSNGLSIANAGVLEVWEGVFSMNTAGLNSINGTLKVGLAGPSNNGQFSFVGTLGAVQTLAATLLGGYEPAVGSTFTAMNLNAPPLGFTSRDLPRRYDWAVDQGATFVRLSVTGIRQAPIFVSPPRDQTAFTGQAVVFSVEAAGTAPLTYQWRFEGVDLPGQTAATLVIPVVVASNAGRYSVVVSNPVDSVPSAPAILTVRDLTVESRLDATGLRIEFPTLPGRSYQVEWSRTMESGSWQPLEGTIAGDGNRKFIVEPLAGGIPYRFYRVIQQP